MAKRLPSRRQLLGGLAAGLLAPPRPARAAERVRLIVPAFPSEPAGRAARVLQPALGATLGVPVLLDFRPVAGGIIGLMEAAHAAADGSVLTMLSPVIAAAPWLAARMDSDPSDFSPIGRVSFTPEVLVVAADSPWRTLAALLAALRANPGRVRTAFDGVWDSAEVAEVLMLDRANLAARPVPGLRAGPALASGTVAFAMRPLPWALARIGRVRALAVSAPGRVAALPGVPTLREAGIEVALGSWLALAGPAGAGAALRPARDALASVMEDPLVIRALDAAGVPAAYLGAAATRRAIAAEYRLLGGLFRAAGVNVRGAPMAVR
ncbi:MAG: tripartite tricarboxylate transporter substrate-binding protein [Acetobacteraceae bacterium]